MSHAASICGKKSNAKVTNKDSFARVCY